MINPYDNSREATPEQREAARQLLIDVKYLKEAEDEARFSLVWAEQAKLSVTSNGVTAPLLEGRVAIMEFYRRNWARGVHGRGDMREVHVAESPLVRQMDNDRLLALHSSVFVAFPGGMPRLIGFGEFRDELVHEQGCWRIDTRSSRLSRLQST